jgi:hypothetical protein
MTACPAHRHDFGALRASTTRILLGVGTQSGQMMAGRAAVAVAERLDATPVIFPAVTTASSTTPALSPPSCARSWTAEFRRSGGTRRSTATAADFNRTRQ